MNGLFVTHHLGLGDAIICNAIYRDLAKHHELVCLPVKYHNLDSVAYMLRDVPNIVLRPVEDDEEMMMIQNNVWKGEKLAIGATSWKEFRPELFDKYFYQQMDLPFERRWDNWHCDRNKSIEHCNPSLEGAGFIFIHQDRARGYIIDPSKLPKNDAHYSGGASMWHYEPCGHPNIFGYWRMIERANEIHCINSSFALFIDSIPLPKNPKLFLHLYARPNGEVPEFRKPWIKLF